MTGRVIREKSQRKNLILNPGEEGKKGASWGDRKREGLGVPSLSFQPEARRGEKVKGTMSNSFIHRGILRGWEGRSTSVRRASQ